MSIFGKLAGFFSQTANVSGFGGNSFSPEQGTRIYAIGDIHGYPDALKTMLAKIHADIKAKSPQTAVIVFLGDYVDRGPDSKGALDCLVDEKNREGQDGIKRVFLTGNHDLAFSGFIKNKVRASFSPYTIVALQNGLMETLDSYGVSCRLTRTSSANSLRFQSSNYLVNPPDLEAARGALLETMPDSHKQFLANTQFSYVNGGYMFVHAAVDPDKSLGQQDGLYLAGLSKKARDFSEYKGSLAKKIVHGHTISEAPLSTGNQIGVDTGVFKHGVMTCAVLEGRDIHFLQTQTALPAFNPEATYRKFFNESISLHERSFQPT
jgi:serine/threonine protein phosphatase 1